MRAVQVGRTDNVHISGVISRDIAIPSRPALKNLLRALKQLGPVMQSKTTYTHVIDMCPSVNTSTVPGSRKGVKASDLADECCGVRVSFQVMEERKRMVDRERELRKREDRLGSSSTGSPVNH